MKMKVNWPALLRFSWAVLKLLAAAAAGGGIVSFANGCSFYGSGIGWTF